MNKDNACYDTFSFKTNHYYWSTLYVRRSHRCRGGIPDPAPSWSQHGAQFGGLWVFPVIKIIVVRQVRKLIACTAGWACKQSHAKSRAVCEDRERICFAFAFVCGRQKHEDPQFEPHGWRRHYTGRYRESGISPLYLWTAGYFYDIVVQFGSIKWSLWVQTIVIICGGVLFLLPHMWVVNNEEI